MTHSLHAGFRSLHFADDPVPGGYLPLDVAALLLRHGLIGETAGRLVLAPAGTLSDRLEDIRDLLAGEHRVGPFRGEAMPVRVTFDGPVLGTVDRSVLRALGLWATKVHINGLVREPGGVFVWLSRRSATSTAEPRAFDTLVAGGQSACETEFETAYKEGREEAGLTNAQMAGLRRVGRLPVQYVSDLGFHQELLAIYDLDVEPAFEPSCEDGEIEEHVRIDLDAVDRDARFRLKHSSRLVCRDLLRRLGRTGPHHALSALG